MLINYTYNMLEYSSILIYPIERVFTDLMNICEVRVKSAKIRTVTG